MEGWRVVSFDRGREEGGRDQERKITFSFPPGLAALRERKKKALIPTTKLFCWYYGNDFPTKRRQTNIR